MGIKDNVQIKKSEASLGLIGVHITSVSCHMIDRVKFTYESAARYFIKIYIVNLLNINPCELNPIFAYCFQENGI